MIEKSDNLYKDLEAVRQIAIVPTILDVVCRITGMGFAAVARVTEDRWMACKVDDRVNFGLGEGDELKIETTICNEIRDSRVEVVFDNASEHEIFKDHHTPKLYGLQSYISFPIILRNGDFFGTLCAIDPKPHHVTRKEVTDTFRLFAELIAFHLESIDLMSRSHKQLKQSEITISQTNAENKLYKQISGHNIKEQVRKIAIFSDILVTNSNELDSKKVKETASRIQDISTELSGMIDYVTKYSDIKGKEEVFESVDLNKVIKDVCDDLANELDKKRVSVSNEELPVVSGIPTQVKELFINILGHAIMFSGSENTSTVNIYATDFAKAETAGQTQNYCDIVVEQKGIGLDEYNLDNAFDIFMHLSTKQSGSQYGAGLAYCRKIVQNHGGTITAKPLPDKGIAFNIVLPLNYN